MQRSDSVDSVPSVASDFDFDEFAREEETQGGEAGPSSPKHEPSPTKPLVFPHTAPDPARKRRWKDRWKKKKNQVHVDAQSERRAVAGDLSPAEDTKSSSSLRAVIGTRSAPRGRL